MSLDINDTVLVRVYPDGTQHTLEDYPQPCEWMSDDFEIREAPYCEVCEENFQIHHCEPFASCGCYTMEWLK